MINALFTSKVGGTRRFLNEAGTLFGWQAIVGMYQRECESRDAGSARMIPRLWEIHIIRDSWTKLNVTPAKIMQVFLLNYVNSLCLHICFFSKNWSLLNCIDTSIVILHLAMQPV